MGCALDQRAPGRAPASPAATWLTPRSWLGGIRPGPLAACAWWGLAVVAWALAPCLLDYAHRRADLLDAGVSPAAWLVADGLLKKTLVASLVVNVLVALIPLWRRQRQALAFLGLIPLHVVLLASVRSCEIAHLYRAERASRNEIERQWDHVQRLEIVEAFSPTLYNFEARGAADSSFASFADLHAWLAGEYRQRRDRLKDELHETDEDRLKTIFYMHFVADLWAFGNGVATDKPGGALANEENSWTAPPRANVRTYVQSRIGCCADYAHLLKFLLDQEKIPNRLTAIPGHVFNEAKLGGRWRIVDGTTTMLVTCSWEELYRDARQDEPSRVRVLIFPRPCLGPAMAADYRAVTGQFRLHMLLRLAARPASFRTVSHPDLPAAFVRD